MIKISRYLPLLGLLFLTSCFDMEMNATLNADGSGEMALETRTPLKVDMGLLGSTDAPTPEKIAEDEAKQRAKAEEQAEKSGVKLISCDIKLEDGFKVDLTKISFTNVEQLSAYFNGDKPNTMLLSLTEKGEETEFKQQFPASKEMDMQTRAMLGTMLAESDLTLVWNFPGEITAASEGATLSEDKRTVSWTVNLLELTTKGLELSATYQKNSGPNYLGITVVGLVALLGAGFLVRGMKK